MNGFIRGSLAVLSIGASLSMMGGCFCYREIVDPCWPERYNGMARHEVNDVFDAQAGNGHFMDQTVWNFHFETEDKDSAVTRLKIKYPTARLNAAGQLHLKYLLRRQPRPDVRIAMQTAQDLPPGTPVDKIAATRDKLNAERAAAIYDYINAIASSQPGRSQGTFMLSIHDAPEANVLRMALPVTGSARPTPKGVVPDWYSQYQGSIPLNPIFGGGLGGSASP